MTLEDVKQMVAIAFDKYSSDFIDAGMGASWQANEILGIRNRDSEAEILVNQILKVIGDCEKSTFVGRFTQAVIMGEIDKKTIGLISRMSEKNQFLKANHLEFLPELARHFKYNDSTDDIVFSRFVTL